MYLRGPRDIPENIHSASFLTSQTNNIESEVRTHILIISDTHGADFNTANRPLQQADLAIHCGDLTESSTLAEFRTTIRLFKNINAPLKLVIAGNHDFTLDRQAFEKKVKEVSPPLDPELVAKEFSAPREVKQIFEAERESGITLLDQGTHQFTLANGAQLKIYASLYTPAFGEWAFQYKRIEGHEFSVEKGVDIAITHRPPKGIMDYTYRRERARCADLFAAVAKARPRIHCFGHIHEGWGAKLVTWKDECDELTHFTAVDNDKSTVIEKLTNLKPSRYDSKEDTEQKMEKLERYRQEKACATSHYAEDEFPLEYSQQTLFVNASISGSEDIPMQSLWLVDVELPRAL